MGAKFGNTTFFNDSDPVGVMGSVEAVRNGNDGSSFNHGRKRSFQVTRSTWVKEARCFVEDERMWVGQDKTGEAQLLGLAWTELHTNAANLGRESLGKLLHPLGCINRLKRTDEDLVRCTRTSEQQIVPHAPNEEVMFLGDERNMTTKVIEGEFSQRRATHINAAASRCVDPGKEASER